jgi:hypothetical protein
MRPAPLWLAALRWTCALRVLLLSLLLALGASVHALLARDVGGMVGSAVSCAVACASWIGAAVALAAVGAALPVLHVLDPLWVAVVRLRAVFVVFEAPERLSETPE